MMRIRSSRRRSVRSQSDHAPAFRGVEKLEQRMLLAAVSWDAGGDGTTWKDPLNWSTNTLPGAADDVTISIAAEPTIAVNTIGAITIKSLVCDEELIVGSGTLTVLGNATLKRTVTAHGPGSLFHVVGNVIATETEFSAALGGIIRLPNLTSYSYTDSINWSASGAGSRIEMPSLAAVNSDSYRSLAIEARYGGVVDLSALPRIEDDARVSLFSDEAGSTINLSNLTSFIGHDWDSSITVSNGGTFLVSPSLTSLTDVALTLGDGIFPAGQLATLNKCSVTLKGVSRTLSGLTSASETNFTALGGAVLSIPSLAAYQFTESVLWSAREPGSRIEMPALKSITSDSYRSLVIEARAGGAVDLSALPKIDSAARVSLVADGTGSDLDLSQLAVFTGHSWGSTMSVTGGGSIELHPGLTSLASVDLTVGAGSFPVGQIASMTKGSLTVKGVSRNFGQLSSASETAFSATDGAAMGLPKLAAFQFTESVLWYAKDPGSRIEIPALKSITSDSYRTLVIEARYGGAVDLSALPKIDDKARVVFTSDGAGSTIDLSQLATFTGHSWGSSLTVTGGGTILVSPALSSLTDVDVTLGLGTFPIGQIAALTRGSVTLNGVARDLGSLATVDETNFSAMQGAVLRIPALTSYHYSNSAKWLAKGGTLEFTTLSNIAGDSPYTLSIEAREGGVVDLRALPQINSNSRVVIVSEGTGSMVSLPQLTAITGHSLGSSLTITAGGAVRIAGPGVEPGISLFLAAGRTLSLAGALSVRATSAMIRGSIQVAGATTLDFDGALSIADAGSIAMDIQGRKFVRVGQLSIDSGAFLDLGNASLIHRTAGGTERQTVLDQLTARVRASRNSSPRWTGSRLRSAASAANPDTGLIPMINDKGDGKTTLIGSLCGTAVTINDVLVKYGWNGDVNLDGRVNADDYFRIDSGFLNRPASPVYRDGDFNFDGKINADDYFLIDQAFLNQKGVVLSAPKPALFSSTNTPVFSKRAIRRRALRQQRA